jgi:hypothetical protein
MASLAGPCMPPCLHRPPIGYSETAILNRRPEFVGDAVQLRFTLLQQAQSRLHHLFIALILAALQLLGHKLFQGWILDHGHILQRAQDVIIAEGQVGWKPHFPGVRLCAQRSNESPCFSEACCYLYISLTSTSSI